PALSPRLEAALALAARAHRAQLRKGTDTPYIVHPVSVAWILLRHGFDEDLVIAALLHDTVEDTDVAIGNIRAAFGASVGDLGAAVTEKKEENGQKRSWAVRKAEALEHFAAADERVAALKAADLLHNLHATLTDVRGHGVQAVFARFNAPAGDWIRLNRELAA